jgi:hypothetical protein
MAEEASLTRARRRAEESEGRAQVRLDGRYLQRSAAQRGNERQAARKDDDQRGGPPKRPADKVAAQLVIYPFQVSIVTSETDGPPGSQQQRHGQDSNGSRKSPLYWQVGCLVVFDAGRAAIGRSEDWACIAASQDVGLPNGAPRLHLARRRTGERPIEGGGFDESGILWTWERVLAASNGGSGVPCRPDWEGVYCGASMFGPGRRGRAGMFSV